MFISMILSTSNNCNSNHFSSPLIFIERRMTATPRVEDVAVPPLPAMESVSMIVVLEPAVVRKLRNQAAADATGDRTRTLPRRQRVLLSRVLKM